MNSEFELMKLACFGSFMAVFSAVSGLELSMAKEHHRCKLLCYSFHLNLHGKIDEPRWFLLVF